MKLDPRWTREEITSERLLVVLWLILALRRLGLMTICSLCLLVKNEIYQGDFRGLMGEQLKRDQTALAVSTISR